MEEYQSNQGPTRNLDESNKLFQNPQVAGESFNI
jgi:hypothetical protein